MIPVGLAVISTMICMCAQSKPPPNNFYRTPNNFYRAPNNFYRTLKIYRKNRVIESSRFLTTFGFIDPKWSKNNDFYESVVYLHTLDPQGYKLLSILLLSQTGMDPA